MESFFLSETVKYLYLVSETVKYLYLVRAEASRLVARGR